MNRFYKLAYCDLVILFVACFVSTYLANAATHCDNEYDPYRTFCEPMPFELISSEIADYTCDKDQGACRAFLKEIYRAKEEEGRQTGCCSHSGCLALNEEYCFPYLDEQGMLESCITASYSIWYCDDPPGGYPYPVETCDGPGLNELLTVDSKPFFCGECFEGSGGQNNSEEVCVEFGAIFNPIEYEGYGVQWNDPERSRLAGSSLLDCFDICTDEPTAIIYPIDWEQCAFCEGQ